MNAYIRKRMDVHRRLISITFRYVVEALGYKSEDREFETR
jgi:hypothetical protein